MPSPAGGEGAITSAGFAPLPQRPVVSDQRIADRVRLLHDGGMAAVLDYGDGDPVTERALELVCVLDMRQRIVVRLQIENRYEACGMIRLARGAVTGDPLGGEHLGVPAGEPAARIVVGREEGELQRLQS